MIHRIVHIGWYLPEKQKGKSNDYWWSSSLVECYTTSFKSKEQIHPIHALPTTAKKVIAFHISTTNGINLQQCFTLETTRSNGKWTYWKTSEPEALNHLPHHGKEANLYGLKNCAHEACLVLAAVFVFPRKVWTPKHTRQYVARWNWTEPAEKWLMVFCTPNELETISALATCCLGWVAQAFHNGPASPWSGGTEPKLVFHFHARSIFSFLQN